MPFKPEFNIVTNANMSPETTEIYNYILQNLFDNVKHIKTVNNAFNAIQDMYLVKIRMQDFEYGITGLSFCIDYVSWR